MRRPVCRSACRRRSTFLDGPGKKKTQAEKQKNKKEHCTFHPGRLHFHSSSASKSLVVNYATVTRYIPIRMVTFSHIS